MVTKVKTNSISATETRFHKNFDQESIQYSSPVRSTRVWSETRTGSDNPGWRQQVRRGVNATTSYSLLARKCFPLSCSAATMIIEPSHGRSYIRGLEGHPPELSWSNLSDPTGFDASQVDLLARQRFVSKYRGLRTAFQGGVFLGELLKTVEMIRNPASALRKGIDHYYRDVKKRLKRSRNRKRVIRDTWLEYSLGWGPLIGEVEDACRLGTASPIAVFENISAAERIDNEKSFDRSWLHRPNGCAVDYIVQRTAFCAVSYKGAIKATNLPPGFPEQLGFSWSNVFPTAWELIPYSWLVDYFTNVGKVVEGVSTGPISLAWGCKNVMKGWEEDLKSFSIRQSVLDSYTPAGGTNSGSASGAGRIQSLVHYGRSPVSNVSVGIGDAYFKLPTKVKQWLNIGALKYMRH